MVNTTNWKLVKSGPQRICARHSKPKQQLDLTCDQDRVLREHFPQTARSHREEILPPDLEQIYEPRHLVQEGTRTTKPRQHDLCQNGKSGSSSDNIVTRDIRSRRSWLRALRHAGARREAIRFVLKELRCPTCEARPLPLPPRPKNVTTLPTF